MITAPGRLNITGNPFLSQIHIFFNSITKSATWLWDNFFTYDTHVKEKHHLTLLAGSSAQNNRYDYMNGSIQNFAGNNTQQLNNGTAQPTVGGSASEWSLLSFIGRANYAFNNKYLVTATLRRDGSSRFGSKNRWGWFPSGSVAWRISDETFMKNISWVRDLKMAAMALPVIRISVTTPLHQHYKLFNIILTGRVFLQLFLWRYLIQTLDGSRLNKQI